LVGRTSKGGERNENSSGGRVRTLISWVDAKNRGKKVKKIVGERGRKEIMRSESNPAGRIKIRIQKGSERSQNGSKKRISYDGWGRNAEERGQGLRGDALPPRLENKSSQN